MPGCFDLDLAQETHPICAMPEKNVIGAFDQPGIEDLWHVQYDEYPGNQCFPAKIIIVLQLDAEGEVVWPQIDV